MQNKIAKSFSVAQQRSCHMYDVQLGTHIDWSSESLINFQLLKLKELSGYFDLNVTYLTDQLVVYQKTKGQIVEIVAC